MYSCGKGGSRAAAACSGDGGVFGYCAAMEMREKAVLVVREKVLVACEQGWMFAPTFRLIVSLANEAGISRVLLQAGEKVSPAAEVY